MKTFAIILLIYLISPWGSEVSRAETEQAIVIQNISVVPMDREGVLENRTVVIQSGKIMGIFEKGQSPDFPGAEIIDGTGKFLSPGLVDAHVHVSLRSDLERYLAHGVTTIREMWGLPRRLRWRDAINERAIDGPNFVVASTFFWLNGPSATMHVEPTDPETARALVRGVKDEGYDLIKIVRIEDWEILTAIMDEAKKQGLRVSGHYPDQSIPVLEMIDLGMASFEHADEIASIAFKEDGSDENIRKVARNFADKDVGITTLLTLAQNYLEIEAEGKDFYTDDAKLKILKSLGAHHFQSASRTIDNVIAAGGEYTQQWRDGIALSKRAAKIFLEEGVALAIGTEGIGPFFKIAGVGAHDEIAFLSDAGLSNFEVMVVGTVNGAKVTGFEGQKGLIKEGYDADLLILNGNPLEDLSVLQNPDAVFVLGRYYSSEDLGVLKAIY